jgi:UDP-N-acetylglucosamine--N-acetylmuramyl-(pentapeptide) pyrophosphoryl-undecaprenol N-acetylglucosamine transferase
MKILLTGGGTIGSVSPLIALAEELKKKTSPARLASESVAVRPDPSLVRRGDMEFLWIGTKTGPEKQLVESYRIPFQAISSGKIRRYFSGSNFIDPFRILAGFFQSIKILRKFKPDIVIGAGGFVSVPVIWAAWFLGIKNIAHQQDLRPGLANKLVINKVNRITVTFQESLKYFPKEKTILIGNPVRDEIFSGSRERAKEIFHLEENLPTILVIGGGTGAISLNNIIIQTLKYLLKFSQIIHLTGKGKGDEDLKSQADFKKAIASESNYLNNSRYHPYDFLTTEIKDALAVADLVISRAGLSTLSELSVLGKPTILVPLSGHQEGNAQYYQRNNAAVIFNQKDLIPENFSMSVQNLINNRVELENLSRNISKMITKDAAKKMTEVIIEVLGD